MSSSCEDLLMQIDLVLKKAHKVLSSQEIDEVLKNELQNFPAYTHLTEYLKGEKNGSSQ